MGVRGVDIASHQGPNFPFVTAYDEGYRFAIIKASGGHSYKNEYLGAQITGARSAGILVGFYHYLFEPTNGGGDIRREAANFIEAVRPYVEVGTTFWLDVEEFPRSVGFEGDLGAAIDLWCEIVQAAFGAVTIGIYCATWYVLPAGLAADLRLVKRPYWIASWQAEPPGGEFLLPWKTITIWQYDAFAMVAGRQPIDEDLFFGTVEDLAALGVPPEVEASTLDPWAYLKAPYGPEGFTVHPLFHADYSLPKYGYPLGPAAEYGIKQDDGSLVKSGVIMQLFENGIYSANGRGEPKAEAAGQVIKYMSGKNLAEWPTWIPLA